MNTYEVVLINGGTREVEAEAVIMQEGALVLGARDGDKLFATALFASGIWASVHQAD